MATRQQSEQQRFEGQSIEEVLKKVRTALGADAEIIEANKVRSGGIGGFFARESFEVIAAPGSPNGATEPSGTAASSLLAIADQRSAVEARLSGSPDPSAAGTPAPEAGPSPSPAVSEGSRPRTRAEAVAQQVMAEHLRRVTAPASDASFVPQDAVGAPTPDGFEPLAAAEMPRLSTEGPAFTDVLQRIATDAAPTLVGAVDDRVPTPGAGADDAGAPEFLPPRIPTVPMNSTVPPAPPAQAPGVTSDLMTRPPADLVDDAASSRTSRLLSWLENDTLPRTTLLSALRGLPQMPELPAGTGIVVAVVGERRRALQLCRKLAKACEGGAPVVLASDTYRGRGVADADRIIDLTDAARDRLAWRRRTAPTFVAVESGPTLDPAAQRWARDVVAELEPHRVIGLVSATRKTEDVSAWCTAVGGVDGLALIDIDQTRTPHAVLALEIPVGFIDGQPASAMCWADTLLAGAAA